jgi:hypothetical protein
MDYGDMRLYKTRRKIGKQKKKKKKKRIEKKDRQTQTLLFIVSNPVTSTAAAKSLTP